MLQFIPETQEQKYLIIRKEWNSDKAWEVRDKSVPDKGIQVKEEDFIYIVHEKIFSVHRSLENDIEKKTHHLEWFGNQCANSKRNMSINASKMCGHMSFDNIINFSILFFFFKGDLSQGGQTKQLSFFFF